MPQDPLPDLLAATLAAESVDALRDLCAQGCRQLGFRYFVYAARFPSSFLKPHILLLSDPPSDWGGPEAFPPALLAPVLDHCQTSLRPLTWRELQAREDQDRTCQRLLGQARRLGLADGCAIPLHGPQGDAGILALGSPAPLPAAEMTARLPRVHLLASYLHQAILECAEREGVPFARPPLSERERECLLWSAEGKSGWEISQILGISERTVSFHLQNASDKLGGGGRQQAVARAIMQRLIGYWPF